MKNDLKLNANSSLKMNIENKPKIDMKLHPKSVHEINLIGDCIETVYKSLDKSHIHLPLECLQNICNKKTNPREFEILKTIAKGGYGEVFLVLHNEEDSNVLYAMKRVPKDIVLRQPNAALFMAEKDLLISSLGSDWLVSAYMTLQDDNYLYYLMDFIPGGDFMGLLSKEDVLEEEWVKFYVVELVAALDELHRLGWIHRDLKPDNILIGKDGHIKLADFGSSIRMKGDTASSSFVVGTPDYISPDILECGEYKENIDFWTLGVIIYEMLFGATPFYSLTLVETYKKITNVTYTFPFKISENIKDLISRLICKKEQRLDIEGIKSHPFFTGVEWDNIKNMVPPFIPEMSNERDTSNFIDTHFEMDERKLEKVNYIDFVGFSYDPKMVNNLNRVFLDKDTNIKSNESFVNDTNYNNSIKTNIEILEEQKIEQKLIEMQIKDAHTKLDEKKLEYKEIMEKIFNEKVEYYNLENELLKKKEESKKDIKINFLNCNIEKLLKVINELDQKYKICKVEVQNIEKGFPIIKNHANKILEENKKLIIENNRFKKLGIENLKKQVRILTTEIKEYQQQINQEISMRKQLEEELKSMKVNKSNISIMYHNQEFVCNLLIDKQKVTSGIKFINNMFYLNDKSCSVGNVYILELKNNELYHESYKNRSLILKIIFIKESVKSLSSTGRRSLKSLEEDYKIELSMKSGLENMMPLLQNKQLEEARLQYEGSLKKISQLDREMEVARKSTITYEEEDEDPIKLYEFNNHLFFNKTFPPGTLCEYCNEVLYGVCGQGFECRDCRMVVHKCCYVLGDVSCETYSAFKKGESFYVLMRSIEDKERLLNVYKRF